jgi:hypothetical protein
LLGSDRETSNETRVIASQQLRKYATVREPWLGNVPTNIGKTVVVAVVAVAVIVVVVEATAAPANIMSLIYYYVEIQIGDG